MINAVLELGEGSGGFLLLCKPLKKEIFLKGKVSVAPAVVKHMHAAKATESRVGWTPAAGYRFPRAFVTSREGVDYFIHFLVQM